MKRWLFFIFVNLIFFLATENSFAAGMIMRVQQMKAMKQQQAQEEYMQAHGQTQQQGAQNQAQGQGPQAPEQPTYQQLVEKRNQALAQAILDAHNQSVSNESPPADNAAVSQAQQQAISSGMAKQLPSATSSDVKDVVDLSEVWKKLDKKSTVWTLLIDDQAKALTVTEYINRFHDQGVKINAPSMHYVQEIDQIVSSNPQMLQRPFGELLQILAIVDYDFDNGVDRDELARHVLGEAGFEENKKRFSQKQ